MVQVRALAGNARCIMCNALNDKETRNCRLIDSKRGRDVKGIFHNVLGVTPIDGVLCKTTCQRKLENLEKKINEFRKAILEKSYEVSDPEVISLL